MKLYEALNIHHGMMISFVGCGGKTSTIEALIREIEESNNPIIHTTTTKIFPPHGRKVVLSDDVTTHIEAVKNSQNTVITLGVEINKNEKLVGLSTDMVVQLRRNYPNYYIFIEADGCKGQSIKLYDPHEPVIPAKTDRTVILLGMDAFTTEKVEEIAHRPEKFLDKDKNKKNLTTDERINTLFDSRGLIEGIKEVEGKYIFINKVTQNHMELAREIGQKIMERSHGCLEGVLLGNTLNTPVVIERIGK